MALSSLTNSSSISGSMHGRCQELSLISTSSSTNGLSLVGTCQKATSATISAPSSLYRKGPQPRKRPKTPYLFPPNSLPNSPLLLSSPSQREEEDEEGEEKPTFWPKNEWFRKELFGLTGWFVSKKKTYFIIDKNLTTTF
jgi:hypothetical protein